MKESLWEHWRNKSPQDDNTEESEKQENQNEDSTRVQTEETPTQEAASRTGTLIFQELLNSPEIANMNDNERKNWIKNKLREIKYKLQQSDFDRIKAIRDKGESVPFRRNIEWNRKLYKTGREGRPLMRFWRHEGTYKAAWRELQKWAREKNVWDEKTDQIEFDRETEPRTPWAVRETARNMGLNVAVAGLYGVGYAMLTPWKAFELGLKYASILTDNEQYTHGMMEKMFRKKQKEKQKGEKKKDEKLPTYAKEHETKLKLKNIEIEYIEGLKDNIIEWKARDSVTPEEYATLTEERKQELKDTKGKRGYENVWRTLRVHWIQEGGWTKDDEEKFRTMISDNKNKLELRDLLTQAESDNLKKLEKEKINLKKRKEDRPDDKNIDRLLHDTEGKIAGIENRMKIREDTMEWPEYKRGKKKGGLSAEDFVVTENEDEEDEEDNDQTP